jgi:endonuclease G, mitochondrial
MKRIIFLALITLISNLLVAQVKVDTVISNDIYKSYYSKILKEPLYISYKLYKGGGSCSRVAFHFKNDLNIQTASNRDYRSSGYDEGHLANAEDFAFDCVKEEETFRFYNCVPQTPNLNRGIWKHWETLIRKESQSDSLLIVCGSIFDNKTTIGNGVYVPVYCWKIVESLTSKKIIHCMIFTNQDNNNTEKDIDINQLKSELGYRLYVN